MIDRIIHRIKMFVAKALVESVDDTDQIQLVKINVLDGEVQDSIERIQNYGMTSNPPRDSEAIAIYLQGNRDHGVVIACDNSASRLNTLKSGEVCVYSEHGQTILMKSNGDIEITGTGDIKFDANTDIELNGNTDFAVAFNDLKSGFDQLVTNFNAHIHPVTTAPGSTGIPATPSTASIDASKVDTVKVP